MTKSNKTITKDGADWVTLATDPFHDFPRGIEGLPDQTLGRSVVRCLNQRHNVAASTAGDKIRVVYNGSHGQAAYVGRIIDSTCSLDTAVTPKTYAPLSIFRCGSAAEPDLETYLSGTAVYLGGSATTFFGDCPSRIIGMGLEIRNTTAQLYQQGAIMVSRVNCTGGPAGCFLNISGDNDGNYFGHMTPGIPASSLEHTYDPAVMTLTAADGVYCIGRMLHPQPPAATEDSYVPYIVRDGGSHRYVTTNSTTFTTGWSLFEPAAGSSHQMLPSGIAPFSIILTGLSAETTLEITFRVLVEYFPDLNNIEMLAVATNSATYDPVALQVYHDVASCLPVAVPVRMNAAGDYWRMVKQRMKQVGYLALKLAPSALAAFGQPELAAVAQAAQALVRPMPTPQRVKKAAKRNAALSAPKRRS